jgi:hypothetical protein
MPSKLQEEESSSSPVRMVRQLSARRQRASLKSPVLLQQQQLTSRTSTSSNTELSGIHAVQVPELDSFTDVSLGANAARKGYDRFSTVHGPRRTGASSLGPPTPEEGVDECRDMIAALHTQEVGGNGVRVNAPMLLWIHRLNK